MKTAIFGAALLAALVPVASAESASYGNAYPDTREGFLKLYSDSVNYATNLGARPNQTCDAVACRYDVVVSDQRYITTLHRYAYYSGSEREVQCFSERTNVNAALCKDSDGASWAESFDGSQWARTATYTTAWAQ